MSSNTTTMNAVRLGVCTLFLTLVFFLVGPVQFHGIHLGPVQVFAIGGGGSCEDFCSDQVDCSDTCFIDLDTGTTCGDYGVCAPLCSDVCGESTPCDFRCSSGTDGDCGEYNGGEGNAQCYGSCGDALCQMDYEDCTSCPDDCGTCPLACDTCATSADCADGDACQNSCCIGPCEGDDCDGGGRSCDDWLEPCSTNHDCCSDEYCGQTYGSGGLCYPKGA